MSVVSKRSATAIDFTPNLVDFQLEVKKPRAVVEVCILEVRRADGSPYHQRLLLEVCIGGSLCRWFSVSISDHFTSYNQEACSIVDCPISRINAAVYVHSYELEELAC